MYGDNSISQGNSGFARVFGKEYLTELLDPLIHAGENPSHLYGLLKKVFGEGYKESVSIFSTNDEIPEEYEKIFGGINPASSYECPNGTLFEFHVYDLFEGAESVALEGGDVYIIYPNSELDGLHEDKYDGFDDRFT